MKSAVGMLTDFHGAHDSATLATAIMLYQEALKLFPESYAQRWEILWELSEGLLIQFRFTGNMAQLDEAISCLWQVQEMKPNRSICLCAALIADYRGPMAQVYLHQASGLQKQIWENNDKAKEHAGQLFEAANDILDLDACVAVMEEAELLLSWRHELRAVILHALGGYFHERFLSQNNVADLDRAVQLLRESVALHLPSHPDRRLFLEKLADAVCARFEVQADQKDIKEAIEYYRQAQGIYSSSHPSYGSFLGKLAIALFLRYEKEGDPKDMDEAITLNREALNLHIAPHPYHSITLNNLGLVLKSRFQHQGNTKDIDETIELYRKALRIHVPTHPNRSGSLNNLAIAVRLRFEQKGDPQDIDEAVELCREALEISVAPHPKHGTSLGNLANAVGVRFTHRGDPRDLDESIKLLKEALEICGPQHPDRDSHPFYGVSLHHLADSLINRFYIHGDPKDLDEALELHRKGLGMHAVPHPTRKHSLNYLSGVLKTRFDKQKDPRDIIEAVELQREALVVCSPPDPIRSSWLANFAGILYSAYEYQPDQQTMDDMMSAFQEASTYMFSTPLVRFSASNKWAIFATQLRHDCCLKAYRTAIDLLPQLAAFHLDLQSRQQMLTRSEIISLASASAICAIGKDQYDTAVEFLEASRSVFWAQALHLRTPLDRLQDMAPELATILKGLGRQLEQASFRDSSWDFGDTQRKIREIEAQGTRCRQLNEGWEETIRSVRMQPKFEDFMRTKSITSLRQAALFGPVIILLASPPTCSALIIRSSEDVQYVQLPSTDLQIIKLCSDFPQDRVNLSPEEIFRQHLAEIWKNIVKPVFDALNLKAGCSFSVPPRLWWCPTGPFAFLPLHAAGIYNKDETDCVSDYAVSSYTPTLAALLDPPTHTTASFKMTAVIESDAPKCLPLPGTEKEFERIKHWVPKRWLTALECTTGLEVVKHLQGSSITHFACHGIQDSKNPLDSGLMLSDGRLKVSQIMRGPANYDVDGTKNAMSLAFLSACETAKGDEQTPDEAMHLAATLLFAGFRGVVATMWTMNDVDGPKIADTFYEYLFKDCDPDRNPQILPDLTKAAEALHFAVAKLRKEPGMTFERWVPFVHYGL
ncbi:CHAT domain-containing protein [Mycena leptocephala]|nr:CHAT domain-containing protein [Mycena leptocephala]